MDRLWAPWRAGYCSDVKKKKACLFCRVFRSRADEENLVIFRLPHSLAMLNLYPYNNGHILVSPRRHSKSLEALSWKEQIDLFDSLTRAKLLLDKTLKPEGYNIGMNLGRVAGAGFDKHLHIHIVPRWTADANFMPVIFDTKIIPQSLSELYRQLTHNLK